MDTKVKIISPESGLTYIAEGKIGGTETFTMYKCFSPSIPGDIEPSKWYVLKIATNSKYNSSLDKEAYILKIMLSEAERQEKAYLKANPGTEMRMNYHFTFPNIVETFVSAEQESRRVLILSLDDIANNVGELVPLSHLEMKEHVRIDQRTSAWIMGKLLKSLVLTHGIGVTNDMIYRDNILINRAEHFVALFNWSGAKMQDKIDQQKGAQEIAQAAQAITRTLGGDVVTGKLLEDRQSDSEYGKLIRKFALGKESSAQNAHRDFYALVDRLWPREFYPFTTHPLG